MRVVWAFLIILSMAVSATTAMDTCPENCYCYAAFVSCSDLDKFPTGFPDSTSTLTLYNLNIEEIPADVLKDLPGIKTLEIYSSNIGKISKCAFSGIRNMDYLTIYGSNIGIIETNAFTDMENVSMVSMYGSKIGEIHSYAFSNLKNIREWSMFTLNITSIDSRAFYNMQNVRYLSFYMNNVGIIHAAAFEELHFIQNFDMYLNHITTMECGNVENMVKVAKSFTFYSNEFFCDCRLAWFYFDGTDLTMQDYMFKNWCFGPEAFSKSYLDGIAVETLSCPTNIDVDRPGCPTVSVGDRPLTCLVQSELIYYNDTDLVTKEIEDGPVKVTSVPKLKSSQSGKKDDKITLPKKEMSNKSVSPLSTKLTTLYQTTISDYIVSNSNLENQTIKTSNESSRQGTKMSKTNPTLETKYAKRETKTLLSSTKVSITETYPKNNLTQEKTNQYITKMTENVDILNLTSVDNTSLSSYLAQGDIGKTIAPQPTKQRIKTVTRANSPTMTKSTRGSTTSQTTPEQTTATTTTKPTTLAEISTNATREATTPLSVPETTIKKNSNNDTTSTKDDGTAAAENITKSDDEFLNHSAPSDILINYTTQEDVQSTPMQYSTIIPVSEYLGSTASCLPEHRGLLFLFAIFINLLCFI